MKTLDVPYVRDLDSMKNSDIIVRSIVELSILQSMHAHISNMKLRLVSIVEDLIVFRLTKKVHVSTLDVSLLTSSQLIDIDPHVGDLKDN